MGDAACGANLSCAVRPSLRRSKGFSLIELIIVIAVISVLISIILDRVWYYQEMAEKTAMEEIAGSIQSALTMQHGKQYVRGKQDRISSLATDNPVKLLQKPPRNYSGEFYDPSPRAVAPGNWMFDLKLRELIYVVDRSGHFVPGKDGNKWIRFNVKIQYEQASRGEDGKELVGIVFEPKEPIGWF